MSSTLFQAIKAGLEEIVVKFNAGLKAYKQATDDSIRQLTTKVDKCIQKDGDSDTLTLDPNYSQLVPTGKVVDTKDGLIAMHEEKQIMWRNNFRGDQTRALNVTKYYNTVDNDEVVTLERYTGSLMTNTNDSGGGVIMLPSDVVITEAEGKPIDDIEFINGGTISFTNPEVRQLTLKTPRNWEGPEVKLITGKAPISDVFSTLKVSVVPGSAVGYTYEDDSAQLASYRLRFEFDAFKDLEPGDIPVCFDRNVDSDVMRYNIGLQLSNGEGLHEFTDHPIEARRLKYSSADKRSASHSRYMDNSNAFFEVNIATTVQNAEDGVTVDISSLTFGHLTHAFETPISVSLQRPETFLVQDQDF